MEKTPLIIFLKPALQHNLIKEILTTIIFFRTVFPFIQALKFKFLSDYLSLINVELKDRENIMI